MIPPPPVLSGFLPVAGPPYRIALKGGEKMPLQVQPFDSRLRLRFEVGLDNEGNPVYSTRTYSGIKPAANDQDVYDIAVIFSELQVYPLVSINRVNETQLVNV
jgi:hypothetical protein